MEVETAVTGVKQTRLKYLDEWTCENHKFYCCFNCMGFDEFLARINNRRKRSNEYGRVLGGVGKEALAMEVDMHHYDQYARE